MICRFRDYGAVTVITAQPSAAPAACALAGPDPLPTTEAAAEAATGPTAEPATGAAAEATPAPVRAALAAAIDAQARRMDQLSTAIVRATAQVAWSGRAAERFRARATERSQECLQLAVALRASADRVQVAAMGPER